MSIPKKVLFIGLGILALGIIVLTLGLLQTPALWQAFQCGYDLGINNSSLTQEQISEYCNNQILTIENEEEEEEEATGLTTVGFGVILIVIGLITTGIGGIWLIVRAIRKQRTETSSEMSIEMMTTTMNNRRIEEEEEEHDDWFTPQKVRFNKVYYLLQNFED